MKCVDGSAGKVHTYLFVVLLVIAASTRLCTEYHNSARCETQQWYTVLQQPLTHSLTNKQTSTFVSDTVRDIMETFP